MNITLYSQVTIDVVRGNIGPTGIDFFYIRWNVI